MVDGGQHLHHELGIQQHAVAGLPPQLLLLPGETAHAQPGGGTQTPVSRRHHRKRQNVHVHVLPIAQHQVWKLKKGIGSAW